VLHNTTEFTYQREEPDAIGITKSINSGRDKSPDIATVCGILMHSSLAVTSEGCPSGWRRSNSGPKEIQRDRRAQEKDQPGASSHREEGEHPMVGGSEAVHDFWMIQDDASTSVIARATSYKLFCAA
jgi:hypothetical protein